MNSAVAAAYALEAKELTNSELAALNNSISWQARVLPSNIGSKHAIELYLIEQDGSVLAREELMAALSFEVNRRVEDGTFV